MTKGFSEIASLLDSLSKARILQLLGKRESKIKGYGAGGERATKSRRWHETHELKTKQDIAETEKEGMAQKVVIKENLWKRIDIETVGDEKNPGFSIYYKYLYDSIPSKPPVNNVSCRALFAEVIFDIKESYENTENLVDFESLLDDTWERYSKESMIYGEIENKKSNLLQRLFPSRFINAFRVYSYSTSRQVYNHARHVEFLWLSDDEDKKSRAQSLFEDFIEKEEKGRRKGTPDELIEHFKKRFEDYHALLLKRYADFEEIRFPELEDVVHQLQVTFGFRGIHFGNYVSDKERDMHVKLTYGAFYDLADVLNCPRDGISLGNRLAIGFGAAGAGKAMAHYDPTNEFINLTKKRGNGALAHEWGHFFDYSIFGACYLAGKKDIQKKPASKYQLSKGQLPSEVQSAWASLSGMIFNARFRRRSAAFGGYWFKPTECFARAFESYVSDKVAKNYPSKGNPYLVLPTENPTFDNKVNHGWTKETFMKPDSHFLVFPQGDERAEINDKFDIFFTTLYGKWHSLFVNIPIN